MFEVLMHVAIYGAMLAWVVGGFAALVTLVL